MAERRPLSRVENILDATINGSSYESNPLSRVEEDLLQLKAAIEAGGGGGGGTLDYNQLHNKPSINGVELEGALNNQDIKVEEAGTYTYDPSSETVNFNYDSL
jgi:hypothetical protein